MIDAPIDNVLPADNSILSISGTALTGNRVRTVIDLAENHSKPNLELTLTDANKTVVSRSFILETINRHVEFTLHVRIPDLVLPLSLTCCTYLDEDQIIDTKSVEITGA
jgi:hypothetical protein